MKRTTTAATVALTLLAPCLPTLAQAQPHSPPGNDYGVVSEEVARQRLHLAGFSEIGKLVKTETGYQAVTMKDGQQHTVLVDGIRGHILENGVKLRILETDPVRIQIQPQIKI